MLASPGRIRPPIDHRSLIEVCAANGSQAPPNNRRRFASIDTVPARATTAQVAKKTRAVANQMHQRPQADPGQEWVTRNPDNPLRWLPDPPFLRDRGWIRRRQTMT